MRLRTVAVLLATIYAAPVAGETAQDDARALFLQGEGAQVRMSEGSFTLPARGFPCANCHGADALGGREGTTRMPPILWSVLSRATETRPAYDQTTFLRAVTQGIDPAGRRLDAVMPRYDLPDATAAALPGFLTLLESEQQAGIGPRALDVIAPADNAVRAGFVAAIDDFNSGGAAHGRSMRIVAPAEPAIFDFGVAESLSETIRRAEIDALIQAARSAGETSLTAVGLTGAEMLGLADFPLETGAEALLLIEPRADVTMHPRIYARRDALDGRLIALLQQSGTATRLVASDPFPDAADWARRNGLGREAALGYALGQIATDAALLAGRQLSHARYRDALQSAAARDVPIREMVVAP